MRIGIAALVAGLVGCGQGEGVEPAVGGPADHDGQERLRPAVPVYGGTIAGDDAHLVVADPARGALAVWSARGELLGVAGTDGARPFRVALAEDRFFVTLRATGEVAAFDYQATELGRARVCAEPRGIDVADGRAVVACAGGELVELEADTLRVKRAVYLDTDLRDVVLEGSTLWVSRFRTAEVLQLSAQGRGLEQRITPSLAGILEPTPTAHVAWRMRGHPDGGVTVLHQASSNDGIDTNPAGTDGSIDDPIGQEEDPPPPAYYGPPAKPLAATLCATNRPSAPLPIVTSHLTHVDPTGQSDTSDVLPAVVLGTDFDFLRGEVVIAGGRAGWARTGLIHLRENDEGVPCTQVTAEARLGFVGSVAVVGGEPVGFARGTGELVTLDDEGWQPLLGIREGNLEALHAFHRNSLGGITCASCHPEATQDGHAYDFVDIGLRRTQDLTGGVLSRAPFHWEADLADEHALMDEIMVGGMSGPDLPRSEVNALFSWLDRLPSEKPSLLSDDEQIARGETIFRRADVGCNACHTGPQSSDHRLYTVRAGEEAPTKTPSLLGLASRAPYMHDGCAPTLMERFTDPACGGGDLHGTTSHLSAAELQDLVAYLSSL